MLRRSQWIAVIVACSSTLCSASACARTMRPSMAAGEPVVQIRLARDSAALGFVAAKWVTGDSVVYISQESALSDDGIEHVGVFPTREGLVLCFSLTADGGARLQQATEQAIGRHAAMLITARVVSMARIMSGIGALRRFTAGVNAPRNVADELAARIIAKWPQRLVEPNCTNIGFQPRAESAQPARGSSRADGQAKAAVDSKV